jgi:hypothetical protein
MTPTERKHFEQMYVALTRITHYQSVERMRRSSGRDWGLEFTETLEYAYENVLGEAKMGLKGVRRSKPENALSIASAPSS